MYTTLYLLKNATNIHEIGIESRREIDVYKILKVASHKKSLNLEKYEDGYKLGEDYIKIYKNKDIRVNNELVDISNLKKVLENRSPN